MTIFRTAAAFASRTAALVIASTIALPLSLMAAPAVFAQDAPTPGKGDIKLAKMLEGRVAGEPQSCIRIHPGTSATVIDGTALVYKVGRTLYVNIPSNADTIDRRDTMVRRASDGSRICRTDIINTVDQTSGFFTGSIFLDDFVPYRQLFDENKGA